MVKKILITGGAGFIGSRLALKFVSEGHEVRVLDSLLAQVHGDDPRQSAGYRAIVDAVDLRVASIIERDQLAAALEGQDAVVHLAAETGTGQSMYEMERYVDVNVRGTALLMELVAQPESTVSKVVVASSRSIYGEGKYLTSDGRAVYPGSRDSVDMEAGRFEPTFGGERDSLTMVPTDEESRIHPSSIYGITKQTQEQIVLVAGAARGIAAIALRYQNVYGPGQSLTNPYTGILSIFSGQILAGRPLNIFEDGKESRDFVFVDDVVEATYRATISAEADGQALNVGSGVGTDVLTVAAALQDAYGVRVPVSVTGQFRIGDIRHNVADVSRLERALDFRPAVTFADGVRRFAEWVLEQPRETGDYDRSLAELRERNLLK